LLILELNSYYSLVMNFFTCYDMEYIHDQSTGIYSRDYQHEQVETCAHFGQFC